MTKYVVGYKLASAAYEQFVHGPELVLVSPREDVSHWI